MSDFDAVLEIKKNLLEEILQDSKDNKVDVKTIVESRLKVVNDMQAKSLENTDEYKAFIESVKKKLTLENLIVQAHEPERDTFEEVDDEDVRHGYPYHMSDDEALELATDDLLADRYDLEEFITGYTEYLDLLKVIIERARQ
jgi:hypothetical protein